MKFITTLTLVTLLAASNAPVCGSQSSKNQQVGPKHTRFPGSRMTLQGDIFLGWPFPIREWFVESAIAGYKAGYDRGCKDRSAAVAQSATENGQMLDAKCPNRGSFNNKAILYAKRMTEFYTRYREDRDLPLNYLVGMLLESKPKTLEQIHEWVSSMGQ